MFPIQSSVALLSHKPQSSLFSSCDCPRPSATQWCALSRAWARSPWDELHKESVIGNLAAARADKLQHDYRAGNFVSHSCSLSPAFMWSHCTGKPGLYVVCVYGSCKLWHSGCCQKLVSQHVHDPYKWNLVLSSLSVCPSGSPPSRGAFLLCG